MLSKKLAPGCCWCRYYDIQFGWSACFKDQVNKRTQITTIYYCDINTRANERKRNNRNINSGRTLTECAWNNKKKGEEINTQINKRSHTIIINAVIVINGSGNITIRNLHKHQCKKRCVLKSRKKWQKILQKHTQALYCHRRRKRISRERERKKQHEN